MSDIGSIEAGMGCSGFSGQDWDHIFNNLQDADWDSNTQLDVDLDLEADEWWPWDDLNIHDINGCSVNNLSAADLRAVEEYLVDAEPQDDCAAKVGNISNKSNRLQSSKSNAIDCREPVTVEHPAAAGDQLVFRGSSKSMDVEDMEYKGLRLLHLLTACAEAISQEAQDLVEVILCRLRGLVSPRGFTIQRVAYYLFDALALVHSNVNSLAHKEPNDESTREHFLGALKLLHVCYPYIRIPHFTANQCILEAIAAAGGANVMGIHVIDFDIMEGVQWPPLMEALSDNGNYDVDYLRVTAIKWADNEEEDSLLSSSGCTGKRLSDYASSLALPFSFQETDLEGLKKLLPSQEREIVIVNCMWQLPHMFNLRNKSQLLDFLIGARHLNPVAVTLATGPHGTESDLTNFLESFARRLEELCSIFDSLEAGLPEHELARTMLERIFFGPAMSKRVMSSACGDRGPADTGESNVVDLPLKCGYGEGSISSNTNMHAQYTLLCSGGSRSYKVELVGHHRLVLKWASTPLVWVSTWKSHDHDYHHSCPIDDAGS